MKKLVYLFVSLFLIVIAAENVNAQVGNTDTENAVASATIIAPLTLTKNLDLAFGTLVRPVLGTGNATINAVEGNDRDLVGNLTALDANEHYAAKFTVSGEDSKTFSISYPEEINITNGTTTLTIDTDISGDENNVTTTTSSYIFYIGGSMDVPHDATSGLYSSTFNVTVSYE